MSFLNLKKYFGPKKSAGPDKVASPLKRIESKAFEWTTEFDATTAGQKTYAFEIGQKVGFPTIWMFSLRPVLVGKTAPYIGISLSLLQYPNKSSEPPIGIQSSFKLEMQRSDPKENSFMMNSEVEDFGTRTTKGMLNFFNMADLHLYTSPENKLRIKISFTLFAPICISKQEVRYKAKERFDYDIRMQISNPEFSDVIVKVDDGQEFRAYRIALARSPYFKKLLQVQALNGQKQSLPIKLHVNKSSDIMKMIICFIHHGDLLDQLVDPKIFTKGYAKALVEAAYEFGLPDLAEFISEFYPGFKPTFEKLPEPEKMEIHEEKDNEVTKKAKLVTAPEEIDSVYELCIEPKIKI